MALRSRVRRGDFADVVLPALPDLPGMISPPERRYLYWLTSQGYSGAGAVVEVGTWLGLSTLHLAAGLRDAVFDDRLHCFDRFIWEANHASKQPQPLAPGDSFQPLFERNIRPVYPKVRVTQSELLDIRWDGGPIEILFLDAPKQLREISAALAIFGPSLVPGLSIVVCQDYLHFPSYAMAAALTRLDDRLRFVHEVTTGSTVSFSVRRSLEVTDAQPPDLNARTWTTEHALAAWRSALEPLTEYSRGRLAPSLPILLHDLGDPAAACAWLHEHRDDPDVTKRYRGAVGSKLHGRYEALFRALGL